MIKNIIMFKTISTIVIISLLFITAVWPVESQSSFTELSLSSLSSAGEYTLSDQTTLWLSEMGSVFEGTSYSSSTESKSGYVEQVITGFGYTKGSIAIEGIIRDWSPVEVTVKNDTLNQTQQATILNNEQYEKIFQVSEIPIIDGINSFTITAVDYFGRQSTYTITMELEPPQPPVINPIISPTDQSIQTLSGTKDAYTSIWINGQEVVPLDSITTWSYNYNLIEGRNQITVLAKNIDAVSSAAISLTILLDELAPDIAITFPQDGFLTNQTELEVTGTISNDVDPRINTNAKVIVNSITAQIDTSVWTFNAVIPLAEGENSVSAIATSVLGHTTTIGPITLTLDTQPPSAPTVDSIVSPTGEPIQTITGTKEVDTSVWLNGEEIYPFDSQDTWSAQISLTHGENLLQFYCKDKAGNESQLSEAVEIFYDSTPPKNISISDDGDYTADFTQLHVFFEFIEEESPEIEIREYLAAIGTTQGGEEIYPFTSQGLNTDVTITGLSLEHGVKYYITARAVNSVGLSRDAFADGIWANGSTPEILNFSPEDGQYYITDDEILMEIEAQDADGDALEYSFTVVDDVDDITVVYFQDFSSKNYAIWATVYEDYGIKWIIAQVRDPYGGITEFGGDGIWEVVIFPHIQPPPGK